MYAGTMMATTYEEIHATLFRERGRAKDYRCACGDNAEHWAYQFTAGDQELRREDGSGPHSMNPDDYLPMCRRCHRRLDLENDPVMRGRLSTGEHTRQRWAEDEEYAEKMRGVLRENLEGFVARRRSDPELDEKMREAARRGVQTRREKMAEDPEYAARFKGAGRRHAERVRSDPEYAEKTTENLRKIAQVRAECAECGLESNRAGIGTHQRYSGHQGRIVKGEIE